MLGEIVDAAPDDKPRQGQGLCDSLIAGVFVVCFERIEHLLRTERVDGRRDSGRIKNACK
jgi:hypothetical protein